MTQRLSDKHPSEQVQITFDYTKDLVVGETLVGASAVVTVTVADGTDASPSAVLNGAYATTTPYIIQPVRNGLDGVDYHFLCLVTTSLGNKYALQAILPVRKKASP